MTKSARQHRATGVGADLNGRYHLGGVLDGFAAQADRRGEGRGDEERETGVHCSPFSKSKRKSVLIRFRPVSSAGSITEGGGYGD